MNSIYTDYMLKWQWAYWVKYIIKINFADLFLFLMWLLKELKLHLWLISCFCGQQV